MPMCGVISCVVGRRCLLQPVHSLGKTLLVFALFHFVLQDQSCLLLQDISQDERMSESPVETLEKALGLHFISKMGLTTMQGNRASSRREGKVSWVFSICGRNLGYILKLQRGCPFETLVCSLKSGTCLGMRDNSGM